MHLRVVSSGHGERTYRYAQLVESYRRPTDRMPAHRVIAHLGALSEPEIKNLRTALAASRRGAQLVLPAAAQQIRPSASVVLENLKYLDVAVGLAMWRHWQLGELLTELMSKSEQEVAPALVVAALTLQRCVAPGSKLYAERWFPRTALPELLGVHPHQFNNTRLHRVLELLDQATPQLQERLPLRYATKEGAFTALFLDVTDTWFVGRGPEALAQKGKTKEGLYEHKIGIVLMCSQTGLPLRWEVIPGRRSDSTAMLDLLDSARKLDWMGQTPVVCDRAMGKTAHLRKLLESKLRFLTALTEDEFSAYTDRIPYSALADVKLTAENAAQLAAQAVAQAGMSRVTDTLYILDLDVVERGDVGIPSKDPVQLEKPEETRRDPLQRCLEQASQMHKAIEDGTAVNAREAGRAYGLQKERAVKLMRLLRLAPDLQEDVRIGKMVGVSIVAALEAAQLADPQGQREALDRAVVEAAQRPAGRARCQPQTGTTKEEAPVRLRAVVCFNPEQFVEQRLGADEVLAQLRKLVCDLNEQLASPLARRTRESAYAEVHQELRRRNLIDAYEIAITEQPREGGAKPRLSVELQLRQNVWQRLRRYDGFSLVVAHPESLERAADLASLYRSRDIVEKDFHVIKSLVQLRPVRHRTNSKVRAHVTLCMLALLLERTLEHKLADTPARGMGAARVFEELRELHLNRLAGENGNILYTATTANQDQLAILKALGLEDLARDDKIAAQITPR